jgi:hypothetical protein
MVKSMAYRGHLTLWRRDREATGRHTGSPRGVPWVT